MKKRALIVVTALLLAAAGLTVAQQQNATMPVHPVGTGVALPPPSHGGVPPGFVPPTISVPAASVAKEVKPEDLTIEQLIEAMEKTRDEIAEREKKNKAMLKVLQEKVNKLKVRMDSFSGKPEAPAIPSPASPYPAPEANLRAFPAQVPSADPLPPPPANSPAPQQP
ncbi:hypothetical protein [Frigoriglobus tundricola]|uniref:Uncharacterized protein n=1 Tax=Frigoriglobus tundricola TaxID=2774151 RepID=A0A6M5Z3L7_9BACT|nr:hypothetical protein [Frigoriglobus tundricola]QJX00998.1 hypothetical protein FTUN_8636 [Frigoriglobus tundricola]